MEEKLYSIKEAALALEVSPDTVRRRIKKGELRAEKMEGPYGQAYYIPENELFEAAEVKEVIPFNRPVTEEKLKQVISEAVNEEVRELREEIAELRQELERTRQLQEPAENQRRPWWKRLF